jgi:hypothetical protein
VGVDHVGGAPRVLRVDLGRDQHRGVAQGAGVEDRRDLADDALVDELLDALQGLLLGHLRLCRHVLVGAQRDRKLPLHEVQKPLVQLAEDNGGALLAAAQLGSVAGAGGLAGIGGPGSVYCSHREASLAW